MTPSVAVVVVAYRSAADLPGCLAAIRAASVAEMDVVVVDNDSPDDTASAVRDAGDVVVVPMGRNAGFAAACNAGVAAVSADYVCFVNPDARPAPGSIDALVDAATRRTGHALYSGKVVTPAGTVDAGCCAALPSLWEYVCFASGLSTAFRHSRWFDPAALGGWDRADERPVPVVSGAFLLVRRSDYRALGGFDERFFMYSEDVDLSWRSALAGRGPLFVPTAVAVHTSGSSSTRGAKATMVLRGKATYLRLHWPPVRRRLGVALLLAGTGVRAAGSRVTGRGRAWRQAWAARRVWRGGW